MVGRGWREQLGINTDSGRRLTGGYGQTTLFIAFICEYLDISGTKWKIKRRLSKKLFQWLPVMFIPADIEVAEAAFRETGVIKNDLASSGLLFEFKLGE